MDILPPCFAVPDSFLRGKDVERRVRKILRLLKPLLIEADCDCGPIHNGTIGDAAVALERAATYLNSIEPNDELEPVALSLDAAGIVYSSEALPPMRGVRGVIETGAGKFLVLTDDGLDPLAIDRIHAMSRQRWTRKQDAIVVLPRRLFEYVIRTADPFLYIELLAQRTLVFGHDPLPEIRPPAKKDFVTRIRARIPQLFTYARSETVFSRSAPLSLSNWESSLDAAMAVRLLLHDDWIAPRRRELGKHWRARYPESAAALEEMKRYAAEGQDRMARQAFFSLLRSVLDEIVAHFQHA
jgi:hypothetical protein